jgi:hypothetical protein
LKNLKIPIDRTEAGIDAETVIPANSPRYAFAAPSIIESTIPKIKALTVISGNDCSCELIGHSAILSF